MALSGRPLGPYPRAHPLVRQLVAYMRDRNLSAREVCDEAGVDRTTLQRWGRSQSPTVTVLDAVANVVGLRLALVPDDPIGREAGLSAKEGAVYQVLEANEGRAVPLSVVMDAIGTKSKRYVAVVISHIRRKLKHVEIRGQWGAYVLKRKKE